MTDTVVGLCPNCGSSDRDITDSRKRTNYTYRRCTCRNCGARYSTYERSFVGDDAPDQSLALSKLRDRLGAIEAELVSMVSIVESAINLNP